MLFTKEIKKSLNKVLKELKIEVEESEINLEHPALLEHGDYSTNIAMLIFSSSRANPERVKRVEGEVEGSLSSAEKKGIPPCVALSRNDKGLRNPRELADLIVKKWREIGLPEFVKKIEVAGPGFINIWLNFTAYSTKLVEVLNDKDNYGENTSMAGKKIMVEFAHPNTHKELHIGHMRTLITGEALSRIFSACGAKVFRANYQGDIGPHVAKAIWGTEKILKERNISWEEADKLSLVEKAHLLGEGYVRGNQDYEKFEKEIDGLNVKLYKKDPQILPVYERTRRWSLQYYDSFYTRFLTKFDQLFFESEIADNGKKIVLENVGKTGVFEESEGAVIFDAEPYGLHKRVFITANGTPTYEAKEMALSQAQYQAFPFDLNVHVVANEQSGYFKVVIKALELLFPELKGKEYHLAMGMVNLIGRKMSSRTGVILRVDDLIEEVKSYLLPLIKIEDKNEEEKAQIAEIGTISAIKYSVLKVGPKADVAFDPEKSVSLQGDSGTYLEYSFARTQSVLAKAELSLRASIPVIARIVETKQSQFISGIASPSTSLGIAMTKENKLLAMTEEEMSLLRTLYKFPEVVEEAAKEFSPNILCNFLFDLAQKFNLFYDKNRILSQKSKVKSQKLKSKEKNNQDLAENNSGIEVTEEQSQFRLALTAGVGQILKNGLNLLGIEALEKM